MNHHWVKQQTQTKHHKVAISLFPLVIFIGYWNPILFGVGLFLFFLITSFKLLKSMLLWMLILGGISVVLPFLAPIIFIVMIILFIMRIGYVVENWRPFVSGIGFYGISVFLIFRSVDLNGYPYFYDRSDILTEAIVVSAIGFVGLHFLLRWLYQYNYTSYAALGIMGSVPVIIVAFVLPFLKLHIGGDFFAAETTTHGANSHAYGDVYPTEATKPGGQVSSETQYTYVRDYVRTAPDGDPTNNLSYNGPDKKMPNTELVYVQDHVRTVPDGDSTNNLSYQGNSENHRFQANDFQDNQIYQDRNDNLQNPIEKKSMTEKVVENSQALVPGTTSLSKLSQKLREEKEKK